MKTQADIILHNGKIYTVDNAFSIVEAVVIKDGLFLDLGSDMEMLSKYEGELIDLQGRSAYPGFIDPHCHFIVYGRSFSQIDLNGCKSMDDLLTRVEKYAKENPKGWLLGRGWDQNLWPDKAFPDNKILNELFPNQPVFLKRIDGHAALANRKALEIAGVDENTIVDGGEVHLINGEMTGLLIDNALYLVDEHVTHSAEDNKKAIIEGQKRMFQYGITSIGDAWVEFEDFNLFRSMHESGDLLLRIYCMLLPKEDNKNYFTSKGIVQTDKLYAGAFKYFIDGALGSRGAALLEDYEDDPGNDGLLMDSVDYFKNEAEWNLKNGFQMNCHAIGDRANRIILQIYSEVLKEGNDDRWRVEHAQIVHPDDLDVFEKYNVIPSIQTTHATSDMYWVNERIGDRVKNAYSYKTLLGKAGIVANGSDFPIEKANPLLGFNAAVTRKDVKGFPENGFRPEERLNREEALKAMTIWSAYAQFEEDKKGSIEKGKFADLVVTDSDIMTCDEMDIYKTKVTLTILAGEKVFIDGQLSL
ncbi:MAG: amidohydrolase [Chitinophagales bacterium]|nr:amidohydrolase [Chitinophagales bacterium]